MGWFNNLVKAAKQGAADPGLTAAGFFSGKTDLLDDAKGKVDDELDSLGFGNKSAVESANATYDDVGLLADQIYGDNVSDLDSYWKYMEDTYGSNASNYDDAVSAYLNSDTYQNEGFNYSNDVNGDGVTDAKDFYDPYANQRAEAAMNAITRSSANAGNMFSSDYVNQLAAKQQALASEEWEKAYNKLLQDKQSELNVWNANSQNSWNNYNATQDKLKAATDIYGTAKDKLTDAYGDYVSGVVNARNANLQSQSDLAQSKANVGMQYQSGQSEVLAPAAKLIATLFG